MKKDQTNIIHFPKAQTNGPVPNKQVPPTAPKANTPASKWNKSLWSTAFSLGVIALASGVSNSTFFQTTNGITDLASTNSPQDRGIASVEPSSLAVERDASWERSLADSLASAEVRDVASISVGHDATLDEKLRYGILERKYTILRDLKRNEVESIILQDSGSEPSMLSDRTKFMGQFGRWMSDKYGFSELKSTQLSKDRRLESFTVFDSSRKAYAVAKFELDNYQRLLAFHFEPL